MAGPVRISPVQGRDTERALQRLARVVGHDRYGVRFSASEEVANVITVTLQVVDVDGREISGRFLLGVWVATTDPGGPGGVQTVALSTGTGFETVVVDQAWQFITDSNGVVVITITVAGAGTRYVNAIVEGPISSSSVVTWS